MAKRYSPKRFNNPKKFGKEKRNARKAGYNKDWDRYRFRFLHHNKLCYACTTNANVVDHIRAHKGDTVLFENTANHMPLCKPCHDYVTGKFDSKREPLTEEKCEWLQKRRLIFNITRKIVVLPYYKK